MLNPSANVLAAKPERSAFSIRFQRMAPVVRSPTEPGGIDAALIEICFNSQWGGPFLKVVGMVVKLLVRGDIIRIAIILFTALSVLIAQCFIAMDVLWSSFAKAYLGAAFLITIGLAYRWLGRDAGVAAACLVTAQLVIFSSFGAVLNYAGAAAHRPLYDAAIANLDKAIGLDWLGYVTAVKSNSTIGALLTAAYNSTLPQLPVAIAILAFSRRIARLDEFSIAFMLAAVLTVALWTAFPNLGELQFLYANGKPVPPFQLALSREEALQVFRVWRDGPGTVRSEEIVGLIGAPSFHTVMALLTMRALWGLGWVSIAAVAVNVLTLLAVPADGGHHFFDVAAGAAVAVFAILAAKALLQGRDEREGSVFVAPVGQAG